jgi:ParB family transcriptional regulator, chromosome partitioning protein
MNSNMLPAIPISEISIANPRPRNKHTFDQVVASIATVGLKTPITVSQRDTRADGTRYDLVCGQGRLEAFLALGQTTIPAIIINASREDQYLMSLIENIARRPPSELGILAAIKSLRERGYSVEQMAPKLGLHSRYVWTLVKLLDNGETDLVRLMEAGKLPLTVAAEIANGTSAEIQRALSQAYDKGELRGAKLKAVRSLLQKRIAKQRSGKQKSTKPLTVHAIAKVYQEHTQMQRVLVKRATIVRERLALIAAACRKLFDDPNFVTLLRAENLLLVSEKLVQLAREQ